VRSTKKRRTGERGFLGSAWGIPSDGRDAITVIAYRPLLKRN
jgi:hypothetical protein